MAAARRTLEARLASGGGHTGWSRAWIIHFWARLLDGYDGPARPLLLRAEYLGLRDGAFLVRVSDEDDKAWRSIDDSNLQQTGRQLLGLPSFMPSVRRMK